MSKILTFEEILAAKDLPTQEVYVPEWDGSVKVRALTKAARDRIAKEASVNGQTDSDRLQVLMLAECLESPKVTIEQAEQLCGKSAAAIDRILYAILDINGLSEVVQKEIQKSFRVGVQSAERVS